MQDFVYDKYKKIFSNQKGINQKYRFGCTYYR